MHTQIIRMNYQFDTDDISKISKYDMTFIEHPRIAFSHADVEKIPRRRLNLDVPFRIRHLCSLQSIEKVLMNIYALDFDIEELRQANHVQSVEYCISTYQECQGDRYRVERPLHKHEPGVITSMFLAGTNYNLLECFHTYLFTFANEFNSFEDLMKDPDFDQLIEHHRMMGY